MHVPAIELLIEQFARLPGIGRKSAERIAFYILGTMTQEEVGKMCENIKNAKQSVSFCSCCQNLSDTDPCPVCSSLKRDRSVICVVETPKEAAAIENTNEYNGLYHVLHGALSPID